MGKIREIWCMHHSHLDIGYTHPQPMLLELQGDYIEQAIALCEKTRDYPEEAQFKWTCEATYPVTRWMEKASPQMAKRFIKLIGEKRISVAALPMHTTPGCTGEQMLAMMKNLDGLRDKLNAPIDTAINHDVNGQPWPMSQLLLNSNVSFYMTGINIHFGGIPFQRPCAFWWETPDGRRLLSFVGEHYSLFSQFFGTCEANTGLMEQGISDYVKRLEAQGYLWDFAFLTATNPPMFDNNCPDAGLADFIRRYNEENHEYKVRFATPEMLRDKLLSMGEDAFPSYGGDWTDYWNFGCGSTARETKVNRLAVRALESANMLECMTGFADKRYLGTKKEAELNALLYEEHTWGASQSVSAPQDYESISQLIHKQEMAYRAADLAGYVLGTQMEKLAGNPFQTDDLEGIIAVNPTGITLQIPLDIPVGWMRKERQLGAVRKKRYIPYMENSKPKEYYAEETKKYWGMVSVPPYSIKALTFEEIRTIKEEKSDEKSFVLTDNGMETPFYKVIFHENRGGIKQIYDKMTKRNLLDDTGRWGFFELVRETIDGKDQEKVRRTIFPRDVELCNQNVSMWNRQWKAQRTGGKDAVWNVEEETEKIVLSGQLSMEGMILTQQFITFYRDLPEIDLTLRVNKQAVREPEGVYLVMPFLLKEGWECVYNTAGQFVKLDEQQLGNTCRDYVTVENGVALYDDEICYSFACPHAPMVQVGGFHFGRENRTIERKANPILAAWPLNNYWDTNFAPYQRDTAEFRYRLKIGPNADSEQLHADFVKAESRGLIGAVADMEKLVAGGECFKKSDTGMVKTLVSCSREGVITGIYPAKKGGFIAALRNHKDSPMTVKVHVPGRDKLCAYDVDVQEQINGQIPVKDGEVVLSLKAYEWKLLYLNLTEMEREKGEGSGEDRN